MTNMSKHLNELETVAADTRLPKDVRKQLHGISEGIIDCKLAYDRRINEMGIELVELESHVQELRDYLTTLSREKRGLS